MSHSDHSQDPIRISKGAAPSLNDAIAKVNSLSKIDISTALEKIEELADSIDAICDAAEKDTEEAISEISNSGTIPTLLQLYSSTCQEVMKLALSALERLLSSEDLAIAAIETGAFEIFSNVFLDPSETLYLKLKASAIIVFLLISDFERGLKQTALHNGLFNAHLAMIPTHTSASDTSEAILRFLFAITDDFEDAQILLTESTAGIGFLLDLIKQRQYQALGPLCNLLQLGGVKSKVPVSEIEALLKPLLHEAEGDIDDLNYDRIVLLLSNLIDSEKEDAVICEILIEQIQDMAFAITDGSLLTSGLLYVLSGINNLCVSDPNKFIIGNSELPKLLMDILQKEGPLIFSSPEDEENGGEGSDVEEEDSESKEIKGLAAKAIWNLAFLESNRKKMETDGTLQAVSKLSEKGDNMKVKRNLEGFLWLFKNIPETPIPTVINMKKVDSAKEGADKGERETKAKQIELWCIDDVKSWLAKMNLTHAVFVAQRIDGRALAEIARNICDIQFLEMVEKRLEFRLFGDLMGFVHAVRKLIE